MLLTTDALWLLLLALLFDALIGDPDWLWRRAPHPVVWIGKLISTLEKSLNIQRTLPQVRRITGVFTQLVLLALSLAVGELLQKILLSLPYGSVVVALLAAVLLAQKSLYQHVARVAEGLENHGLEGGRKAVSMIVGRDPDALDESGVCRAAIESAAENFSDGVVAPAFWFAVLGLPGIIAYKAVNTADSMIGHKTPRYQDFGWAAARFDDLVNLPASRLAGLFIALAALCTSGIDALLKVFSTIRSDASQHRSPNAGWPESAMAGALNAALAGPRTYPGYTVNDPFMNPTGRKRLLAHDIRKALRILIGACTAQAFLVLILAYGFTFVF